MANFPFAIKSNDVFGRYLVASRNIKEGELILKELPMMVGPQISGALVCFKCNCHCNDNRVDKCTECNVAIICTKNCQGKYHPPSECTILRNTGLKAENILQNSQIILPLRCLLLEKYNKDVWNRLMEMEPHLEKRRNTTIWRTHQMFVFDENNTQSEEILVRRKNLDEHMNKCVELLSNRVKKIKERFTNESDQDDEDNRKTHF